MRYRLAFTLVSFFILSCAEKSIDSGDTMPMAQNLVQREEKPAMAIAPNAPTRETALAVADEKPQRKIHNQRKVKHVRSISAVPAETLKKHDVQMEPASQPQTPVKRGMGPQEANPEVGGFLVQKWAWLAVMGAGMLTFYFLVAYRRRRKAS